MADSAEQTKKSNVEPTNDFEEMSPKQRYVRFEDCLSKSTIHSSFRGFDTRNGVQILWHVITLVDDEEAAEDCLVTMVEFQKSCENKYIVAIFDAWRSTDKNSLNLITAVNDTLKEFVTKKCSRLRWRIVKKWCKQILRGLDFLHKSSPVVVHRCCASTHIYVDSGFSGQGAIKCGDLWFSAMLKDDSNLIALSADMVKQFRMENKTSHIPPEALEGGPLTTKGDIFSFGMSVLEVMARDEREPYREFRNDVAQIEHQIRSGFPPAVLSR